MTKSAEHKIWAWTVIIFSIIAIYHHLTYNNDFTVVVDKGAAQHEFVCNTTECYLTNIN